MYSFDMALPTPISDERLYVLTPSIWAYEFPWHMLLTFMSFNIVQSLKVKVIGLTTFLSTFVISIYFGTFFSQPILLIVRGDRGYRLLSYIGVLMSFDMGIPIVPSREPIPKFTFIIGAKETFTPLFMHLERMSN